MISSVTAISLLLSAPFPDEISIVQVEGVPPRMNLILDSSCSMGWVSQSTNCTWFANAYNSGSTYLNLNEQMRAVMLGCVSEGDGILDKWNNVVDFAIYDFRGVRAGYDSTLAELRTAAAGIPASGGTPLVAVQKDAGEYMNANSNDSNTESCQEYIHLLLSDGNPNGWSTYMDQDCVAPVESLYADRYQPWVASEYLYDRHEDVLCNVSGEQSIRTYTLGFGPPGWFNPKYLQNTALLGGGQYYYAQSVVELIGAFDSIIGDVVSDKQSLVQLSIGQDNFFSANRSYGVNFETNFSGPWYGNIRRMCIFPEVLSSGKYDTTITSCLLKSVDGEELLSNPDALDLWTGQTASNTTQGGAGEVMLSALGSSPSTPYWSKRNLLTWRPGTEAWVRIDPSVWTESDSHQSGCDRYKLINYLHGYTYDANCDTGDPLAVREWPIADPVHAAPLELRYGACEDDSGNMVAGRCYVVLATNNGILHFFDTATGEETSGIVPGEIWRPSTLTAGFLGEINDQPSSTYTHRYYLDGIMELYHYDQDFDGNIDAGEEALLFFSLGRAGNIYYILDVSDMSDGVVDDNVKVYPLTPTSGTVLENIAQTWSAPVFAQIEYDSATKNVAIIPSGHEPLFDFAERTETPDELSDFFDEDVTGEVSSVSCSGAGGWAEYNGYGTSGLCSDYYTPDCEGTASSPCYDGSGLPMSEATRTLGFTDGIYEPAAIRVYFSSFDLGDGDSLRLLDSQGQLVATYTGQSLEGAWSDWVYDQSLSLQLVTDGVDSDHSGYAIDRMEWEAGFTLAFREPSSLPEPELGVDHKPAIYMIDIAKWNGSSPQAMADYSTDDGILWMVSKDCSTLGARCIDENQAPDLSYMICPITGAPAPYLRDGRLAAIYFGDECGQLFKVYTEDGGLSWLAKRILNLNNGEIAVSIDHRKIFGRIDVVESLCPGREVVGVYFGTGNVQRPLASDELTLSSTTDGFDVVGVLWDNDELPDGLTQSDLVDATASTSVDPVSIYNAGKYGWLLRLNQNERMLRDPIVVDGVAYFKTFQPDGDVTACSITAGLDRIYAVNNCSAEAVLGNKTTSERLAWTGNSVMATGLTLLAPKEGIPIVVHGDLTTAQKAAVGNTTGTRPGVYFWREM